MLHDDVFPGWINRLIVGKLDQCLIDRIVVVDDVGATTVETCVL